MAYFRINLAKNSVKPIKQRYLFYNSILLYVFACAVVLVYLCYNATINLMETYENRHQQQILFNSLSSSPLMHRDLLRNPDRSYKNLKEYSKQIQELDKALTGRVQFLPILHQLFGNLPENVQLEQLKAVATERSISFSLQVPITTSENGDSVRQLQTEWNANSFLMDRITSIRPVTGERRTSGDEEVFMVKFECVLKR